MDEPSGLKDSTHLATDPHFRLFVRMLNPPISPASWNLYCTYSTLSTVQYNNNRAALSLSVPRGSSSASFVLNSFTFFSSQPLTSTGKILMKKKEDGLKKNSDKKRDVTRPRTSYNQLKPKPASFSFLIGFFKINSCSLNFDQSLEMIEMVI